MGASTQRGQVLIETLVVSFILLGFFLAAVSLGIAATKVQVPYRFGTSRLK